MPMKRQLKTNATTPLVKKVSEAQANPRGALSSSRSKTALS